MSEAWALAIFAAVVTIASGLVTRILLGIDRNQKALAISLTKLWENHNELSKDFYIIKGAHEVNHFGRRETDNK